MNFRVLVLALLLLALPFGVTAQKSPSTTPQSSGAPPYSGWPGHGFPHMGMGMMSPEQINRSLDVLQKNLNLTDSQTSQVRQLVESRRARMESARDAVKPKFEELMRLMNRPNPDTYAVGRAALALKEAHERALAEQASVEKDFMDILNDSQRRTVDMLRSQAPTFMALHRLRLLTPAGSGGQQASLFGVGGGE